MLPQAYDAGLKPQEIGELTAGELRDLLAADSRREGREWDRFAWLASLLLNAWREKGKAPIKPQDLLGRPFVDSKKSSPKKRSREEAEREKRLLRQTDGSSGAKAKKQ